MTRSLPSLRTSITKSIVALSLFAILLSSVVVTPAVQARGMHELIDRGGRVPGVSPDLGGDDDQPTVIPQPTRRAISAAVSESGPSGTGGAGGTHLDVDGSLFTTIETVVNRRVRALWALLLSPVR